MSSVRLTINDSAVEVPPGTTILNASRKANLYIPSLCFHPSLPPWDDLEEWPEIFQGSEKITSDHTAERPDEGCGLCMVAVEGLAEPVRACITPVEEGMRVQVEREDLKDLRQEKLAGIFHHHPHACLTCAQKVGCSREPCSTDVPIEERCCPLLGNCELERVADYVGLPASLSRFHPENLPRLTEDPLFERDYNLCIGCTRCVRACRDLRGVDAIGFTVREGRVWIGTKAPSLADSDCRFCTACVEVCPTGALRDRNIPAGDRHDALVACRAGCPARTDVPLYVSLAAEGLFADAAAVVRERAPLPFTLGHICFHPCEEVCRRTEINEPIAIRAIKRTAAEEDDGRWKSAFPTPTPSGKKVAVIGAGPAGLTASYFLRAAGHHVTLMEKETGIGGMLRTAIPAFRLPREGLDRELTGITDLGIEVITGFALGRDGTVEELLGNRYDALLLAIGAGLSKTIPLPGSELDRVYWGLEFLRETNIGTAPDLHGSCVIVGGGNVAMDVARSAWRLGAEKIDLLCLESEEEIPAYAAEIREALEEGVNIHHRWGPTSIHNDEGAVKGIEFKRCLSVFDSEGTFAPTYDDSETCSFSADSVILAIGQEINWDFDASPLKIDAGKGTTDRSGLFVAGDFATGPLSVIEAIASARRTAETIDSFLGGSGNISLQLMEHDPLPAFPDHVEGFAELPRQEMPRRASEDRRSFSTVELGLTCNGSESEGSRCLRCDKRLEIEPVTLPPRPWIEFTAEKVAEVPAEPGAFQLLDESGRVVAVVGAPDLAEALTARLNQDEVIPYFIYQLDPMFTKLESELLQQTLQEQGEMPEGSLDELDDLY